MSKLVADVGGTNIRVAIIEDGKIIAEHRVEAKLSALDTKQSKQAEQMLTTGLCHAFQALIVSHQPSSIAIGFPGFFFGNTGVLHSSPNIPLLHDFDLAAAIAAQTALPTTIQNDALCAALGEYHYGVGQQSSTRDLMHITLGTGVGAGLILNGQPYTGQHGMAMEFGHLQSTPIRDDVVMQCGCGNHGCLETYASATAVAKRYSAYRQQATSAQEVARLADHGNQQAQQIIHHAGLYLGAAIAESSKLLDISAVSVSGGLTGSWSWLYPAIQEALQVQLIPPMRQNIQVQRSLLGDNAGLLGANHLSRS